MTNNLSTAIQNDVSEYVHYNKFVEPDKKFELLNSTLKWYDIAKSDEPVLPEIKVLARRFLEKESANGNLKEFGNLGFAILHRCGEDFYFLLINTWRNGNELWETVYAKNGAKQNDFRVFEFKNPHHPTFCVWELAAVRHEQESWKRYLFSAKDTAAKQDYLQDCYQGAA